MLHALLHHKLDESIPVSRRLEDAVTSSVFGTLLLAGAERELAAWLSDATGPNTADAGIRGPLSNAWFWPRLALAEPDVVLQFENRVVIVEAKVASDRHDLNSDRDADPEDWTSISNQIERQWRCATAANPGPACPVELAAAFRSSPPTVVFLVDERRLHRARPEFEETMNLLPQGADLRLLTWQSLHRQLVRAAQESGRSFWRTSLIEYLERAGLAGFVGFRPAQLPTADAADAIQRLRWAPPRRVGASWREMASLGPTESRCSLLNWSIRGGTPKRSPQPACATGGRDPIHPSDRIPQETTE